VAGFNP